MLEHRRLKRDSTLKMANRLESRREYRELTLKTAKIFLDRQTTAIDCAILNISIGGACIMVPTDAKIPDKFDLTTDHDGMIRTCAVAWRAGSRIGVSFLSCLPFS